MSNIGLRLVSILVVLIAGIASMYPNFVDIKEGEKNPSKRLKYGLDIQGGLHLVMGVDIANVVVQSSQRMTSTITDSLKEDGIVVSSVVLVDQDAEMPIFQVNMANESDYEKVEASISKYFTNALQIESTEGKAVKLRYFDGYLKQIKDRTLGQAIETIRNRIDEFGVSEPSITAQGSDRILIQLPGLKDATRAKGLINKTAFLEFQLVQNAPTELGQWIEEAEQNGQYTIDSLKSYTAYYDKLNKDLKAKLPKDTKLVFGKAPNAATLSVGKVPYLVTDNIGLTGEDLKTANVSYDEFGNPEVSLGFNPVGSKKFADVTGDNVGRSLAVVLDQVVYSAPNIQTRIGGGSARITLGGGRDGKAALEEAKVLSMALRAGALPARLEQLEERTVGPTLGADSIAAGKKAVIIGSALVLLFMLFYYKAFGVIANFALVMNIFLILSLLTALDATLTLPGIAGIALTVGMAVDANVIIFERIKEELLRGQNLRKATEDGFKQAFSAIFDANITTGVVCVILMYFGTGPVRGFAVTLLIGLVTSMFTAIFVSKTILDAMFYKWGVKKLSI